MYVEAARDASVLYMYRDINVLVLWSALIVTDSLLISVFRFTLPMSPLDFAF